MLLCAVYILDDGKDPDKKAWVQNQNDPEMAYTPGHIKSGPEINGKACNLNATLRALFPAGSDVAMEEVSPVCPCCTLLLSAQSTCNMGFEFTVL